MQYVVFEKIMAQPRMSRYITACSKKTGRITFAENGYFFCLVMVNLGRNFGTRHRIMVWVIR